MSDAVAVAETRQLRESLRNLLRHLISPSHLSSELFRRQRWLQAIQGLRLGEMGRYWALKRCWGNLRLTLLRGIVTLSPIAG
jgi:hypothetical protein